MDIRSHGQPTAHAAWRTALAGREAGALRAGAGGAFTAGAATSADLSLRIVTDEGDTVTLSTHAERDATRAVGVGTFTARTDARRSLSLSVQGDLSARERADIARLLQRIERVVQQAFRGNEDAAMHQVRSIVRHLGSLEGFTLEARRGAEVSWTGGDGGTGRTAEPLPLIPMDGGTTQG